MHTSDTMEYSVFVTFGILQRFAKYKLLFFDINWSEKVWTGGGPGCALSTGRGVILIQFCHLLYWQCRISWKTLAQQGGAGGQVGCNMLVRTGEVNPGYEKHFLDYLGHISKWWGKNDHLWPTVVICDYCDYLYVFLWFMNDYLWLLTICDLSWQEIVTICNFGKPPKNSCWIVYSGYFVARIYGKPSHYLPPGWKRELGFEIQLWKGEMLTRQLRCPDSVPHFPPNLISIRFNRLPHLTNVTVSTRSRTYKRSPLEYATASAADTAKARSKRAL